MTTVSQRFTRAYSFHTNGIKGVYMDIRHSLLAAGESPLTQPYRHMNKSHFPPSVDLLFLQRLANLDSGVLD